MRMVVIASVLCGCGRIGFSTTSDDAVAVIGYAAEVLADNPLGYWRLDDVGATARDEMGGPDGVVNGACERRVPGALAGDSNGAMRFDGATCKITLGDRFGFVGVAAYTLEAWVSVIGVSDFAHVLTRQIRTANNGASPIDGYAIMAFTNNGFYTERVVSTNNTATTGVPLTAGFHHLAAVFDGTKLVLYFDGEAVDAGRPTTNSLSTIATDVVIGGTALDTVHQFDGDLDEIAIYGTALSAERIDAHHRVGIGL